MKAFLLRSPVLRMSRDRWCLSLFIAAFALRFVPDCARAEYHAFNTASGADGIIQEVRWPYWAESTYNAIYSQTLSGSDGGSCYFYGGMPSDPSGNPPCSIIWSFWPPSGTAVPGAAVTAYWSAPNMYAPPHVGEGASGKVSGDWPLIQSNRWYREVFRVWQPANGTPHLGFVGRWLRDSATGNWYHLATMQIPFTATGINGLSGFQEDFGHGNRKPRRTDYRNVYYLRNGTWSSANQFTPSVRQLGENGTCGLIENATAAFFETATSSNYLYSVSTNLPPTTGNLVMLVATNWPSAGLITNPPAGVTPVAAANNYAQYTLTITNQPATPAYDSILVSSSSASVSGNQLIAQWQLPASSSPQFAYKVEVFANASYTGSPAVVSYDIDPEARQRLLDITGVTTPYVRLTITDVFNNTNTPIQIVPVTAALSQASSVAGAVNGLAFNYYESPTNYVSMPNFSALTSVYQGAVDYPDLTLRRQRSHYAFNFSGFLSVPSEGLYTFTLNSCDGSRLVIDDGLVVNWDGEHSPGPLSGWAALQAGLHKVNIQYFFDNQNSNAGDLIDGLGIAWSGPGIAPGTPVPISAWFRVPGGTEPVANLLSPSTGAILCNSNVLLSAAVTSNSLPVNRVQFYVGNNFWGQDNVMPFSLNTLTWSAASNLMRARVFYNATNALDSAPSFVTTTNMSLAAWLLASMSDHVYPNGARVSGGSFTLLGDGLNLLGRQVNGDCTLVAHLAGISGTTAAPDGQTPGSSWSAGIIFRGNTNSTPGTPLGNSSARYACVFGTVNNGAHFEDDTMANAGGPYWSADVGNANRWYKIQRVGDVFTTSVSSDGVTWAPVNTNTLSGIGTTIYAGVFTYAASSQNPNVHWATFDNVSLVGNVVGPPGLSITPQSDTAFPGQSSKFTALPSGSPPFAYQWQYDRVSIPAATNATLVLTNLQPTNSGLYSVTLSNGNGTATSTATLTVLTPPAAPAQILTLGPIGYWRLNETSGPTVYDAVGGFNGTTEGNTLLGVNGPVPPTWSGFGTGNLGAQFNGNDSDIAIPPLNVTTTNFTITGWVRCDGAQTSWSGLVFGRSGGRGTGLMEVNNGANVELRYSWNDNGADYNWSTGLNLPTNGLWSFVALAVEPNRAIVYLATNSVLRSATNSVSNSGQTFNGSFYFGYDPNSSSRRLKGALDEVAFYSRTLTRSELTQLLGSSQTASPSVSLLSPADGAGFLGPAVINLTATVVTNGHNINKVQFLSGSTLLNEITNPPYSFTWSGVPIGIYTVLAQAVYDGSGLVSSPPANISVNPPVSVLVPPQSRTNYAGTSASFSITAAGSAPLTYQWQFNGRDLPGATDAALTLTSCLPADAGGYAAVVTDPFSSATSAVATLTVLAMPSNYLASILAVSPLAYWRLSETAGSALYDSVGTRNGSAQGGLILGVAGPTSPSFWGFDSTNRAAQFNGTDTSVALPALNLVTNSMTITCWLKRSGTQTSWSGLFFSRANGTVSGFHFGTANDLRYTWNNGSMYNWSSGLVPPDGAWTFAALVIEPTQAHIYMATNATLQVAAYSATHVTQTFSGTSYLGYDPNQSIRRLNGCLDEVAVFSRALTEDELSLLLKASLMSTPSILLTSPASGATFSPGAAINVAATVNANGHAVSKVQFYDGASLLAQDTNVPYGFTWSGASAGAHLLTSSVVYDTGTAVSATNSVLVWDESPPILAASLAGQDINLLLSGTLGQHFRIEYASAVPVRGSWQVLTDITSLASSPMAILDSAVVSERLYRAVSLPPTP